VSAQTVVVLGASRSGTSAVARLLNLLGVDLGREDRLLAAIPGVNPKGFFEHRDVVRLNDEILRRHGGDWLSPPDLPAGWEEAAGLGDLREEARGLVEEEFGASALWGFKDPRTCLTLPFWRPLLGDCRVVICHRDPLGTAASVRRRDGLPLADGIALWTRYVTAGLVNAAGLPRVVVGYAELFSARDAVVGAVAGLVGRRERAGEEDFLSRLDEWLDPSLRHEADGDAEVPADAAALAALLDLAVLARGTPLDEPVANALDAAAGAIEGRRRLPRVSGPRAGRGSGAGRAPARAPKATPTAPGPVTSEPEVSIVVLVHETPAEAEALVGSVVAHTFESYELILVDNGSSPLARDALERLGHEARARLVRLDENTGFAVGCNAGLRLARGGAVALLNSDCLVGPRWLTNLRAALDSSDDVVAVGPRSNSAHLAQGGIWLDDTSPAGVADFARRFNRSDPARWFEVDWLIGFALLARRDALEAVGGFNEAVRTGDGEDRDLGERLRARGGRLLCAGDTFVFHAGQRAGLNRTSIRYGRVATTTEAGADDPGRLLREASGRVFEVSEGVACHVETGTALRLIRDDRPVADADAEALAALPVGAPICLSREAGTERVWLMRRGRRQLVRGDPARIRRLPGLSLVDRSDLESLPVGEPLAVEAALPPVPEIPALLPVNPIGIVPDRLAGADVIADDIGRALETGEGYALMRCGPHETWVASEGAWPVGGRPVPGDPTPAELRRALLDADAVAVSARRDAFACAPLTEQVLFHLDRYPRRLCDADIVYALSGFDPGTGESCPERPLIELLRGRGVAVVGPLAEPARRWADAIGLDVRIGVAASGETTVEGILSALETHREDFDAVLVAGGTRPAVVCTSAARGLGAVALDLGPALERMLYVRHGLTSGRDVVERWQLDRYLQAAAEPPPDEPDPLEGQVVQAAGAAAVYYVERGLRRWVGHRELLNLFPGPVRRLPAAEVERLPLGHPITAVVDPRRGPLILLDGRAVPLDLRMPMRPAEQLDLGSLSATRSPISWYPGAPG
jgi:GT2 family glycosyltransferase